MKDARIGVLVSGRGRGSNFGAIARASREGSLRASVALLVATDESHGAVDQARAAGIDALVLPRGVNEPAEEWEQRVCEELKSRGASCVALAGFMRRVSPVLLGAFPSRVANVHPSLLPSFGGAGMFGKRVHEAVIRHGCRVSGCTVHLLDEKYDSGPIIAQKCVPVEPDDTPEVLAVRVQAAEHELYPQCLSWLANDELRVEGRRVLRA
jgi:phosphoribosylglycinamide formyltransferase-1